MDEFKMNLVEGWERILNEMILEVRSLRKQQQWFHGPIDLLGVIGASRKETFHSKIIAWLLDPWAQHGLGTRLLELILNRCFPSQPFYDLEGVVSESEVVRGDCRADIVLWGAELTLVVENKVDFDEQERQCDRNYDAFKNEPGARFIFLTPQRRPPKTATGQAAEAFQCLSYRDLLQDLEAALRGAPTPPSETARGVAEHYLAILRHEFVDGETGMDQISDERVRFYLRHRREIEDWHRIETQIPRAVHNFLLSCTGDIEKLGMELENSTRCHLFDDNSEVLPRILLFRPTWVCRDQPRVGIGLGWYPSQSSFYGDTKIYTLLWVNLYEATGRTLAKILLDQFESTSNGFTRYQEKHDMWWLFYRIVPPPDGADWDDLNPYRGRLLDEIRHAWTQFAAGVDKAVKDIPAD